MKIMGDYNIKKYENKNLLYFKDSKFKDVDNYAVNDGSAKDEISRIRFVSNWQTSYFFRMLEICNLIYKNNKFDDFVVDLGCSTFNLYRYYNRHFSGIGFIKVNFVGIDLNRKSLQIACENRIGNPMICINEDIFKGIPISGADCFVLAETIEHAKRSLGIKLLRNIYDSLKPGGKFILSSPNPNKKDGEKFIWKDHHVYEYSLEEILHILKNIGFKLISCSGVVPKIKEIRKLVNNDYSNLFSELEMRGIPKYILASTFASLYIDKGKCKNYIILLKK